MTNRIGVDCVDGRHGDVVDKIEALAEAERIELGDTLRGMKGKGVREPGLAAEPK